MFEFVSISKQIQDRAVLQEVSYQCKPGEFLGVLGPHASGKSILLKLLAGILPTDTGEIRLNGEVLTNRFQQHIGYLPEERAVYQRATVLQLLVYFGRLRGMTRHEAEVEAIRYLDRFQIIQLSKQPIHRLEKPDQQKIEMIAALIHNPDVILFDEPFKGLDITNQILLQNVLETMKNANKTVIIGSHNMELIESICDSIILLNKGEAILSGNAKHILHKYCDDYISLVLDETENYEDYLLSRPEVTDFFTSNNEVRVILKPSVSKQDFIRKIMKDIIVYKYQISQPSLKDLFLKQIPLQTYKEQQSLDDQIH